jgi:flagellar hook-length control protein FliK
MTTVQLSPLALPGRGAQGGGREALGTPGGGRNAAAFGTLFHGHLTERHGDPGPHPEPRPSVDHAGIASAPGGAVSATARTAEPQNTTDGTAPDSLPAEEAPAPESFPEDASASAVAPHGTPASTVQGLRGSPSGPDVRGGAGTPASEEVQATEPDGHSRSTDDAGTGEDAGAVPVAAPEETQSATAASTGALDGHRHPAMQGPPAGGTAATGTPVAIGPGVPNAAPQAPVPALPQGRPPAGTDAGPSVPRAEGAAGSETAAASPQATAARDQAAAVPAAPGGTSPDAAPSGEAALPRPDLLVPPPQVAPGSSAPGAAPPAATASSNQVRTPAPLPQQLGAPAFALVQSAADTAGKTSTITLTVAPDDLGPITIRASVSAEGTRLEFFSATDGGREALRQALPDLRREASSSGLSAALDLGTGTPDDGRDGTRDGTRDPRTSQAAGRPLAAPPTPWAGHGSLTSSTLDLFA